MKTNFTEAEIAKFIMKELRQLHGESLLLPTRNNCAELEELITSPQKLQDISYELGEKHGAILGQVEMLKRFTEFFEIDIDIKK